MLNAFRHFRNNCLEHLMTKARLPKRLNLEQMFIDSAEAWFCDLLYCTVQ